MHFAAGTHDGADPLRKLLTRVLVVCAFVFAIPAMVFSQPIAVVYGEESVDFDLTAEPALLPRTHFETSTVWTEGSDLYEGVLLKDLLLHLGVDMSAPGGRVVVEALDGYSAEIEFDLITQDAPLLAFLRNGHLMPRRAQGPYWLIFPYDHDARFRTESIYAQSVWQVTRLTISY